MPRTKYPVSRADFVADPASVTRSTGRQVDWENVNASFVNSATGKKELPPGLRVKVTAAGKLVDMSGTGTLFGLIETAAIQDDRSAALTGYGVVRGGIVYVNLLPETLDGAAQTALAEVGTGFAFETYGDDRAS